MPNKPAKKLRRRTLIITDGNTRGEASMSCREQELRTATALTHADREFLRQILQESDDEVTRMHAMWALSIEAQRLMVEARASYEHTKEANKEAWDWCVSAVEDTRKRKETDEAKVSVDKAKASVGAAKASLAEAMKSLDAN